MLGVFGMTSKVQQVQGECRFGSNGCRDALEEYHSDRRAVFDMGGF